MIPIRSLPNVRRLNRDGRAMRGNVVYLWSGPYEQRMRRPHEDAHRFATPATVIELPCLFENSHASVRDAFRDHFRQRRAALRTKMIREHTCSLCKGAN